MISDENSVSNDSMTFVNSFQRYALAGDDILLIIIPFVVVYLL